jgi:hypothetical protein
LGPGVTENHLAGDPRQGRWSRCCLTPIARERVAPPLELSGAGGAVVQAGEAVTAGERWQRIGDRELIEDALDLVAGG